MYSLHQGGCNHLGPVALPPFFAYIMVELTEDACLMCALCVTLEQSSLI